MITDAVPIKETYQRLEQERQEVLSQQRELDSKLLELSREMVAMKVYEATKSGNRKAIERAQVMAEEIEREFTAEMRGATTLGQRLKVLRAAHGATLDQACDATGITRNQLHILEKGTSNNPKLATLRELARYYRVSVGFIIGEDDHLPISAVAA